MAAARRALTRDELRDRQEFFRNLREAEEGDRTELRQAANEFLADMRSNPKLIAERIDWLLTGAYGKGAFDVAAEVLQNRRMNRRAWLLTTVAALDWRTPRALASRAYNRLTMTEKRRLNREISGAIASRRQRNLIDTRRFLESQT